MSLVERVQKDMVQAMKEKDAFRTSVLRMIKAALKNKEIDKRGPLTDADGVQVLQSLAKQRTESVRQFEAGGRVDLAQKEDREKQIIEAYLPKPISEEEIEGVLSQVIRDLGAGGMKDMGDVMKETMARLRGTGQTVDGKVVQARVRARLEALVEE